MAALLVIALCIAGDTIRVFEKGNIIFLTEEEFENFLVRIKICYDYGTLAWDYQRHTLPKKPAD